MALSFDFNPVLFTSTFGLIFIAELPDKTAFSTLVLATRYRASAVFLGVASAFVVQSAVAVAAGSLLALIPRLILDFGTGALFLVFAAMTWREHGEEDSKEAKEAAAERGYWRQAWTSFLVVFIAEWGDLTQLATGALAARSGNLLSIFLGSTLALCAVAVLAIVVGNRAGKHLNPRLIQRFSAVVMAGVGLYLLFSAVKNVFSL